MQSIARTIAFATVASVTAAAPAMAAEVEITAAGPVVELQVSEQVMGDPDKAMVSAGVTTRAATATAAMQQAAAQMDRVLKRLDALGVPRERVQTSGITLNPQYNYQNNQPPKFIGYDASNTVSIELRDTANVGEVLDALVAAGATNINGPNWGLVDDSEPRAKAREAAFAKAFVQAREYARMAGYSDVKLLSVAESMGFSAPVVRTVAAQAAAPPPPPSPTRPGQVSTQVTLSTSFELVK
ncbi:SIMPL domain-containing protein [Croceicoccus mobilis]|uniref:SIMPL domain-containing protein n=1 Tax=Croceicoccus mobilis TaxID=1703339 RepID=A0A916Z046_9SPHN|nr:SIMPL domain-containing protein [Croceicoccus mobilis]GGD69544.1 hypothetical protein GCM10010990_18820 [Croceicoccus mobilis]